MTGPRRIDDNKEPEPPIRRTRSTERAPRVSQLTKRFQSEKAERNKTARDAAVYLLRRCFEERLTDADAASTLDDIQLKYRDWNPTDSRNVLSNLSWGIITNESGQFEIVADIGSSRTRLVSYRISLQPNNHDHRDLYFRARAAGLLAIDLLNNWILQPQTAVTSDEKDDGYTPTPDFEESIVELHVLRYYGFPNYEDAPSDDYDVPETAITENEFRELARETAQLTSARLIDEKPFTLLSPDEIKEVIAHGKKNPWSKRHKRGWPYHTNAFKFLHITYRRWVNRGLSRDVIAKADPGLYSALNVKISKTPEGLPQWLDVPTGAEARMRAIKDPSDREKLKITRSVMRDLKRKYGPSQV
ncbi:hypothetical protein [Bradyrhizobium sp. STM 3809]|uniref:hypothetical protein n=1 Tax=Bradyrhizobium sp. STM 3809 TaxID=551936 RepID=UPI0011124EAF|nr:hypothetical protein [Bradyrhizobium sp. STM 3809]